MPMVVFTAHLERHLACPSKRVGGKTVRQAFDKVFAKNPTLRGYVLDDQGRLRQHVAVFVDDAPLRDRERLSDSIRGVKEIFVLQSLSGG